MVVEEIMSREVVTVTPLATVKEIAEIMLKNNIGGVPVVDAQGKLLGIVTEQDLIMKDVKIHFPTYIQLLDAFIYVGGMKKYEEELRKALGATAEDVMTKNPITVSPETEIGDAATLMVEKGVSRLPVVEKGNLVGIITKRDIVRSIAEEKA